MTDDDSLHVLLANGRLSGAQRDRIFERAMQDAGLASRWTVKKRWRPLAAVMAGLLPVAALVALLLQPGDGAPLPPASTGHLVAKGVEPGLVLGARCPGRRPGLCRRGDRLVFELEGTEHGGYLVAYALCASGERIWYFPNGGSDPPAVRMQSEYYLLDQAARIGDEHGVGTCSVHLRLVDRPVRERPAPSDLANADGREFIVPITVEP